MSGCSSRFQLKQVAFFGRTLAEYLKMFSLDLEALRGQKILDIASGPGSFVAEVLAMGLDATGCDPMYAQDADTIAAQGKADIDSCREQIRRNPGVLVYRDIDAFYGDKYVALEKFAADFWQRRGEGRYVAGALPNLPFPDRHFDWSALEILSRRSGPGWPVDSQQGERVGGRGVTVRTPRRTW